MFKYKSVYFINFDADDPINRGFSMGTSEDGLKLAKQKGMSVPDQSYVTLGRERASLPTNTQIPLIQLNFDLSVDERRQYRRCVEVLREKLQNLEVPAKLYILAHSDYRQSYITQKYQPVGRGGSYKQNKLDLYSLADIFSEALPHKSEITFHFLSCSGISCARYFLEYMFKNGFRSCFAIGYTEDVYTNVPDYGTPQQYYELTDFSTESRVRQNPRPTAQNPNPAKPFYDCETKFYKHRREHPDLPDNKFIAYYTGGEVRESPYQRWLSLSTTKYGIDKKNLFRYNFIAILLETEIFFMKQTAVCRVDKMCQLFECYRQLIKLFLRRLEGADFSPPTVVTFIKGMFRSVDLWSFQAGSAPASIKRSIEIFRDNFEHYKTQFRVIIPTEAEQLGFNTGEVFLPPGKFKSIWQLYTPPDFQSFDLILDKMLSDKTVDFRGRLV